MAKRDSATKGFVNLHLVVILLVVVAVVGISYKVVSDHTAKTNANLQTNTLSQSAAQKASSSASKQSTLSAVHPTATGGATVHASISSGTQSSSSTDSSGSGSSSSSSTTPVSKGSSSSSTATYLVTGTFVEAPTRPVCSLSSPCSAPIANHTVKVYPYCLPEGSPACPVATTATTTTDSQGKFSLHLPVGHYTLMLSPAVGVSGQSWSFDEIGSILSLQLTAKTGIE